MTLDEILLEKARAAGGRLEEAERQALLARADYHTAVRRLHLAGGSFREVAHALALSHQRVQQIVDAAGGSWWKRVWRTRGRPPRDAVCTFCGRPPSEVAKLVAGPDVYICDGCVARAEKGLGAGTTAPARSRTACSFCGKRRADDRPLIVAEAAAVCADCLRLCRDFVDGQRSP